MHESFIGIDLAGSTNRPTGIAITTNKIIHLLVVYGDEEIISLISRFAPKVVAIDAPLTKPDKGKTTRLVDTLMRNLGFKVLPPGFPGMMKLTERGVKLKKAITVLGVRVLETHPLSAIKALGLSNRKEYLNFMYKMNFHIKGQINNHTIDALVAAYTALLYLKGKSFCIKTHDGEIILPIINNMKKPFRLSRRYRHVSRKHPRVAVDVVILSNHKVILVKRLNEPYKDHWALPGGFVEYGETVEHAAIREAKEETGLDVKLVALVGVYSNPKRDPRGHVISITFLGTVVGGKLKASTDAKEVKAFNIDKIPEKLAFDHAIILKDSLNTARKLGYLS